VCLRKYVPVGRYKSLWSTTAHPTTFLLRPYGDRVICIRHPNNYGPLRARNTGITATKADYIAFLDSGRGNAREQLVGELHSVLPH
jgi:glycosyltransferase involved in cell wall biosynthesis